MRINVLPLDFLTDQHLGAEYTECHMLITYFTKSSCTKNGIDPAKISRKYTLNNGHAYFFYDKFQYVVDRHIEIYNEMRNRGRGGDNYIPLNLSDIPNVYKHKHTKKPLFKVFGDYKVTNKCIKINVDRIIERIEQKFNQGKPKYYTLNGKPKTLDQWKQFYNNLINK